MNSLADLTKIEKITKALGDPYRIRIIEAIRKKRGWMQCSDILELTGLSQPTTSHHIKLLVEAELIIAEKHGRKMKYAINKDVFAAFTSYLTAYSK